MKIYLSTDMEGTAAVCSWSQCDPSNLAEYPLYRRYMTQEVRAAIEGARAAGATQTLVNDSHWSMRNLLWEELPPDARVISGTGKPLSMMQGIDDSFQGAFFTGYHGRGGEQNAVLAHTYTNETLYDVRVNGISCSEALLNAALAGTHGVPVLLITGDQTTVHHVCAHLPWVTGVAVKRAIGQSSANSLTPAAAQAAIREAATQAVRNAPSCKPFTFASPTVLEIDTVGTEHADFIELMPGFERVAGRTLRFTHAHYAHVFQAFIAAMRLSGAASAAT